MGFATFYEVWVNPICDNWHIILPMTVFYFTWQIIFIRKLPSTMPNWAKLNVNQRENIIVRCCSIVNGVVMSGSAYLFLRNLVHNGGRFPEKNTYKPLAGYGVFRCAISAYFVWDIVVCFYYKWSLTWKVHGLASFIGSYTLLFPYADDYAGYYTGCFELSNAFLHASVMMRTLSSISNPETQQKLIDTLNARATLCEYAFGLLYALIRVVGGTYVTYSYISSAVRSMLTDYKHSGEAGYKPLVHDELAVCIAVTAIGVIQLLQYVWFNEIVKAAIKGGGAPVTDDGAAEPKSPDANKKRV